MAPDILCTLKEVKKRETKKEKLQLVNKLCLAYCIWLCDMNATVFD